MKRFIKNILSFTFLWIGVYVNRPDDSLPVFSGNWWIVFGCLFIGVLLFEKSE